VIGVVSGGDRPRLVSLAAFAGAICFGARDWCSADTAPIRGVAMPAASGRIARVLRRAGAARATTGVKEAPSKKAPARKTVTTAKAPAKKATAKKAPAKKASAKKAPAKKASAKKAPAKKITAKKAPAKKITAKKAPAKTTAKKAPAKKATVKRAPAKKTTAKKAPAKIAPARPAEAVKTATKRVAASAAAPVRPPVAKKTAPRIAVPRGSDWTPTELADVRTQLVRELGAMQGEYDRSMQDLNDLQLANSDGAGDDQADAGSKTFEREQELSIAANRLDLLAQIQRAVERIDAGTYGFCESCGRPIPKARLKAFPMATLDVACKQREERR